MEWTTPLLMRWIDVQPNGCWVWRGTLNAQGYGIYRGRGAYRVVWETLRGRQVPKGLHLDHLCRNKACVNPEHLEPVTREENGRRNKGHVSRHTRKPRAAAKPWWVKWRERGSNRQRRIEHTARVERTRELRETLKLAAQRLKEERCVRVAHTAHIRRVERVENIGGKGTKGEPAVQPIPARLGPDLPATLTPSVRASNGDYGACNYQYRGTVWRDWLCVSTTQPDKSLILKRVQPTSRDYILVV